MESLGNFPWWVELPSVYASDPMSLSGISGQGGVGWGWGGGSQHRTGRGGSSGLLPNRACEPVGGRD